MKNLIIVLVFAIFFNCSPHQEKQTNQKPLQISGVYPHLAVFNEGDGFHCNNEGGESGIGAIVPWQGKLWMITYSQHCPYGSSDKLYSIDENLNLEIMPQSVGGTPAGRMIHKESNQLIIGPYFIDEHQTIRVIPPGKMPGRLTAIARHLTDPANWVYFYDMEGALYEANVHTLEVNELFKKPIPGWHGKGAFTAQHRLILANNGEHQTNDLDTTLLQVGTAPKNADEMGCLAEWDGQHWQIVERKQFTDVTGPGGIYGNSTDTAQAWSIGWDRRSVILKLLDHGNWYTYRLPKSTHTYDHWGGWYTEWPRIREVTDGKWLMDMHGMFYDFPPTFNEANTSGIVPLSNHLRYIPDFCAWNGQLLLSTDETSKMENPFAGRAQSNLWFGHWNDLKTWGPVNGWGGPWVDDEIKAGEPSDPYLINGFNRKILHLAQESNKTVHFTVQIDKSGNNHWENYTEVEVPPHGYKYYIFPESFSATWIRVVAGQNCKATAFFHYTSRGHDASERNQLFTALADIGDNDKITSGVIRPAAYNKSLQFINLSDADEAFYEINEKLEYTKAPDSLKQKVMDICTLKKDFDVDNASVIVKDKTGIYRLPKTNEKYDQEFQAGWPRGIREVESERYMFNVQGTFFEFPREAGLADIRPVATHEKRIQDFCTWRGLLVISGTSKDAKPDGHYFASADGASGLWFGAIDDLWKFGQPTGFGGPWKDAHVKAAVPSDAYLMTGYNKKKIELTSNKDATFTIQVDFDHNGWYEYKKIEVPANQTIKHQFPDGFSAHWVRIISNKDCVATAWFLYE